MTGCTCGTVRLIGDVHGDVAALRDLRERHPNAVQIGDLGYGFAQGNSKRLDGALREHGGMRFFRGNHDDPERCMRHPKHLASGPHPENFFVVGGGLSIDWQYRTEGVNWWRDEEHSARELRALAGRFAESKPRLVLSHEGPPVATDHMFKPAWKFESATAQALQAMWEAWQPDLWVFGHWHRTREVRIGKTLFVCLGEKEKRDVHLPACPEFSTSCTTTAAQVGARLAALKKATHETP